MKSKITWMRVALAGIALAAFAGAAFGPQGNQEAITGMFGLGVYLIGRLQSQLGAPK